MERKVLIYLLQVLVHLHWYSLSTGIVKWHSMYS